MRQQPSIPLSGFLFLFGLALVSTSSPAAGEPGVIQAGLGDTIDSWLRQAGAWFTNRGPSLVVDVLVFIAILVVFRIFSRVVRRAVTRSLDASRFAPPQLLRNMIVQASGNVVMALGLLIALSQVGVSMGPLLAGIGAAGFVVGFALKDTLANFAAGVMLLFYRPYDVGDVVEAGGVTGKVGDMSLVSTTIRTPDNQTYIVPNGKIWGDVIRNVTSQATRRVDMVFGISYEDDVAQAESVLRAILEEHEKVLDDPKPVVKLDALADSSVNFVVRPWTKTEDYWDVFWDVTREVKMRFDREGISIPYPQRDVHIHNESPNPESTTAPATP